MYRIIGADGREYGPVSAAQLRQWIVEGRANSTTSVLPEGSSEWRPLGSLPEFIPGATAPAAIAALTLTERKTNSLAMTGLILGIVSLTVGLCCCHGLPFSLLGLIFSLIGLSQVRSNPQIYQGEGIAIGGIICSVLGLLIGFILILVFGAMSFLGEISGGRRW